MVKKLSLPETVPATIREPYYTLPQYTVNSVAMSAGQKIDWGLSLLGVPELWKITRGEGVRVAILDTGISPLHHDLAPAIELAQDFTGSRSGYSDVAGHGTHCAGTIAARDNDGGVVGIANQCSLLIGKVLGDDGSGASSWIAKGIRWAADNKADIISMSLGSPYPDPQMKAAIDYAVGKGVIVISAAGNEGPGDNTTGYPGGFLNVISVGAIDQSKRIALFSSRGKVDIAAPGVNILSDWPPRSVASLSGTSMACPFVVGVAALIIAKHKKFGGATPADTPQHMIDHLLKTAVDEGIPGKDPAYGWGIVDPSEALDYDERQLLPSPEPAVCPTAAQVIAASSAAIAKVFAG